VTQTDIALHETRRFAMAANYLRTNGFTTPLFSFAIAGILWQWFPAWLVFGWAAITSTAQFTLGFVAHFALRGCERPGRLNAWRARLLAAITVSGAAFACAVMLFYVPGERLNNILLIATAVGSLATLAAMTAPDRGLMIATTGPFAFVLCFVMAVHEPYPYNLLLSAVALLYCAETYVTAGKLSNMVGQMLDLQIGNGKLISSLALEKAEAEHARVRAESASRAKSNFLANMSHELRTPLNAILGFSEVIRDRTFGEAAAPRYSAYASDIHDSGRHLLALINDILDLSRIEAGKWELAEAVIEMPILTDSVVKLTAPLAEHRGIDILSQCDETHGLFADRKAVAQILINLVSNAVKFTAAGGQVCVTAKLQGGAWVLEVRDTGCGISPEDMPRVLERFGQARHDVASVAGKGVGLGLPITKGLVEMHGGSLTIESEMDVGTVVRVEFPQHRTIRQAAAA
jgi:two-component system, cell cycle sensor histidine kinase PleC